MLGSASFVIFYLKERSQFLVGVGVAMGARFGTFFLTLSVGRFSIDDISLATSSRVFSWILPTGFHVSISFLFGWSGSCLLYLSTVSMRDLFLVRSLGFMLASISQAAVGVVRNPQQLSHTLCTAVLGFAFFAPQFVVARRFMIFSLLTAFLFVFSRCSVKVILQYLSNKTLSKTVLHH